ncbi:hypothetical protein ACFE04_025147 [Oxalis oulophora]
MAFRRSLANCILNKHRSTMLGSPLEHSFIRRYPFSLHNIRATNLNKNDVASPRSDDIECVHHFESEDPNKKNPKFNNIFKGDKEKHNSIYLHRITNLFQVRFGDSIFVTMEDTKKLLKLYHIEKLRKKLKKIPESQIEYSEFVQICSEESKDKHEGLEFARMLNECGSVIVFGNIVLLKPDQVIKSIESLISHLIEKPDDPRRKELEELHNIKLSIDREAMTQVRKEISLGLGYFVLQTLGCMRLTFVNWTWDVMEPICYFVTSIHFAIAYSFFLKTSTEPSFEGYSRRRFQTKQNKLIELKNFDVNRYNKLCNLFGSPNFYKPIVNAPKLNSKMDL